MTGVLIRLGPVVAAAIAALVAQQILHHHLSSAGYTVRMVSDSREALPTIDEHEPPEESHRRHCNA